MRVGSRQHLLLPRSWGPLEVVVSTAGGWSYPRLTDLASASIHAELDQNLVSALLVLRESAGGS